MKKIKKNNWKYCECGCKGYDWGAYWLYWDLGQSWKLYKGHGSTFGQLIKNCRSMNEATDVVKQEIKKDIQKLKEQLV